MPKKLLSATLLICERTIQDAQDGVFTLVRVVDAFFVAKATSDPPEKRIVPMQVWGTLKGEPGDTEEHNVELTITTPDGNTDSLAHGEPAVFSSQFPDGPVGFNLVARIAMGVKQLGLYSIAILVDGEECARTLLYATRATC